MPRSRPPADPEMLRSGEVALRLGVDRRTVARWTADGLLLAEQTPGGHHRYRASVIDEIAVAHGPAQPDEQLLTVAQVVERFGVSYDVFRRMARAGRVPSVQTAGGQRRFRLEDVQQALSAR